MTQSPPSAPEQATEDSPDLIAVQRWRERAQQAEAEVTRLTVELADAKAELLIAWDDDNDPLKEMNRQLTAQLEEAKAERKALLAVLETASILRSEKGSQYVGTRLDSAIVLAFYALKDAPDKPTGTYPAPSAKEEPKPAEGESLRQAELRIVELENAIGEYLRLRSAVNFCGLVAVMAKENCAHSSEVACSACAGSENALANPSTVANAPSGVEPLWGVWCERDGTPGFWRQLGTGRPQHLQTTKSEAIRRANALNENQKARTDSLGWKYEARVYVAEPAAPVSQPQDSIAELVEECRSLLDKLPGNPTTEAIGALCLAVEELSIKQDSWRTELVAALLQARDERGEFSAGHCLELVAELLGGKQGR